MLSPKPVSMSPLALMNAGRLADVREYALAVLCNFETYGDRAAEEIQRTQRLIAKIEQEMGERNSPPGLLS